MKDDTWRQDVHRLVDDSAGDLVSPSLKAVAIRNELVAPGYSGRRADALIKAEAEKCARRALGAK